MNLLHMKYAAEVAKTGSINKAAKKLLIGQPNLSRAIKELETSLGTKIFERSASGMVLTSEGELFMNYAKGILKQIDALEETFVSAAAAKRRFSVSVPQSEYVARAFAAFSLQLNSEPDIELFYCETEPMGAINNILQKDYRLALIRYSENQDKHYKALLNEKGLSHELIAEFKPVLIMSESSPLVLKEQILAEDLAEYMEVSSTEQYLQTVYGGEQRNENVGRRIFVSDRAARVELLAQNPMTYMWTSPMPPELLKSRALVCRSGDEKRKNLRDVLVYKKDYTLSRLDNMFVAELKKKAAEL